MIVNTFVAIFLFFWSLTTAVIVEIPNGKLLGRENKSSSESKRYYSFQGIPYAVPPLGSLRFQPPVAAQPWSNVFNATVEGMTCIPVTNSSVYPIPQPSAEDCLFINVFSPSLNASANLPVMFWIYGGGFITGNGNTINYGPDYFIEQDVILVTFNYRLGPFGFLSTGDHEILGNAGLKDQVLALKWTKNNIQYFGGDPTRIVIFGESAGGMSVGLHLVSKQSAGLFSGAICQSGCSLSVTIETDPRSVVYELANASFPNFSWSNISTEGVTEFLRSLTAEELASAAMLVDPHKLIPCLEIDDKNAFVTRPIFESINSGEFNKVPLVIGQVSEESLGFLNKLHIAEENAALYDRNQSALVPATMNVCVDCDLQEIGSIIKEAYIGNGTFFDNIPQLLNFASSTRFTRATLKQAELQSQYSPVYMYIFSFYGCKSKSHYTVEGAGKVGHFDDMPYFFKMTAYPCDEISITKKVTALWANFAKSLNPTPIGNLSWPQVKPDKIQYFNIDDNVSIVDVTNDGPQKMWEYVYDKYAVRPFIVY